MGAIKEKRICPWCSKEFIPSPEHKKYCSSECQKENEKAKKREKWANRERQPKDISYKGEIKICPICNKEFKPKTALASQRQCCYECMPEGQQLRRSDFITKIKMARGAYCRKCGYNTYVGALEFHHKDPNKKDFTISDQNFKLSEAIKEIDKCILLCANCHRELHGNLWKLEDIL